MTQVSRSSKPFLFYVEQPIILYSVNFVSDKCVSNPSISALCPKIPSLTQISSIASYTLRFQCYPNLKYLHCRFFLYTNLEQVIACLKPFNGFKPPSPSELSSQTVIAIPHFCLLSFACSFPENSVTWNLLKFSKHLIYCLLHLLLPVPESLCFLLLFLSQYSWLD